VVILQKGSREYGQPPVIGMVILGRFKKSHRGTELLDELAAVLPALSQFTEEEYLDFAAAITVLNRYWLELRRDVDEGGIRRTSEFIRILNRMFALYCPASKPAACGVLVILCHVESRYLPDDDAQLVRNITNVHIDRAASIIRTVSISSGIIVEPQAV
jgi:hypothetical protein